MKKTLSLIKNIAIALLLVLVLGTPTSINAQERPRGMFTGDPLSKFTEEGVTNDLLQQANPLNITGSAQEQPLSTPGGIISRVLLFAFPIAGLILFVMILWGGFEMLLGASDKKSLDAGRQRITAAVIGFLLLFVSFWIIRVVETVFGIKVLF